MIPTLHPESPYSVASDYQSKELPVSSNENTENPPSEESALPQPSPWKEKSTQIFQFLHTLGGEKTLHLLVGVVYLCGIFFFVQEIWDFVIFAVATFLGMALVFADKKYFFRFYQEKEKPSLHSQEVNQQEAPSNQDTQAKENFYVTSSALFLLSLIPLSLYVFTSAGSFWALGTISGIFLYFLVEMYSLLSQPRAFFSHFLQGMKAESSQTNTQIIFSSFIIFFIVLHVFVIL